MARKPPPPFKRGNTFGKGRPKGSRNRLSERFLAALCEDFEKKGRENYPQVYLRVLASFIPKEWHIKNADAFESVTEDEIRKALVQVRSLIAAGAGAKTSNDASRERGEHKSDLIH